MCGRPHKASAKREVHVLAGIDWARPKQSGPEGGACSGIRGTEPGSVVDCGPRYPCCLCCGGVLRASKIPTACGTRAGMGQHGVLDWTFDCPAADVGGIEGGCEVNGERSRR